MRVGLLIVALLCFPRILPAETPNAAEPWIRQLDHVSWHKRVEASQKLSAMGMSARDSLLEAVARNRDTEGGRRAAALLKAFPACLASWSRVREQYESHVRRLPEYRETDDFLKRIVSRFDKELPSALVRYEAAAQDHLEAVTGSPQADDWDRIQKKMTMERGTACALVQKAVQDAGGKILTVPREIPREDAGVRARGFIDVFDWRIEYGGKVYRLSLDERRGLLLWPEVFDQERLQFRFTNPLLAETLVGSFSLEGQTLPVVFATHYDVGTQARSLLLLTGRAQVQSPIFGFYRMAEEYWLPLIPKDERDMFYRAGRCEGAY